MNRLRAMEVFAAAGPVMLGLLSQNLMSLVDTVMVGPLGSTALAALGLGAFVVFMCHALTLGLSTGVQNATASDRGARAARPLAGALHAGLITMLAAAPFYIGALWLAVPRALPHLNPDTAVVALATPYVEWRLLAIVFVGMNFAFRGYWVANQLARVFLYTTLLMHALNIVLNYALIYGHLGFAARGVEGAGLASLIATIFGTLVNIVWAMRLARPHGFLQAVPLRTDYTRVLAVGLPYGVQQLLFAAAFTVFFWVVGQIGTDALAAATVVTNLTLFVFLPGIGFGIAAAARVSHALAQGARREARDWAHDVVKVAAVTFGVLGAPMWLAPKLILAAFIHDSATLSLAVTPLRIAGLALFVEALALVLTHALYSAGRARAALAGSVTLQWAAFLPAAFVVGPLLGWGLSAVWAVQALYRAGQAVLAVALWRRALT